MLVKGMVDYPGFAAPLLERDGWRHGKGSAPRMELHRLRVAKLSATRVDGSDLGEM